MAFELDFTSAESKRSIHSKEFRERLRSFKTGYIGIQEEVANVISFLDNKDSEHATEQVVGIDGGILI